MRASLTAVAFLVAPGCGGAEATGSEEPAPPAAAARPAPAATGVREAKVVRLGDPAAKGGLSADEILAVVKKRRPDIDACYETELQQRSSLAGKVVVTWAIAGDGRAQDVQLKSTTLANGKVVRVTFPLIFQPAR